MFEGSSREKSLLSRINLLFGTSLLRVSDQVSMYRELFIVWSMVGFRHIAKCGWRDLVWSMVRMVGSHSCG